MLTVIYRHFGRRGKGLDCEVMTQHMICMPYAIIREICRADTIPVRLIRSYHN